jgi:asparaginyl-tRNA synthetase
LFEVGYFERKAYLTQSGQLYAEASAMAFGKVYCFGPTFRAEKSKTRRHLTEFWMLEPEVAFATLEDVLELAEDMLVHVVAEVLRRRQPELEALERDPAKLRAIQKPFPRLTYDQAAAILKDHPDSTFRYGDDLGAPDETILSLRHDRPVMITHYPAAVKAFYMKREPGTDKVKCVDVIGPEGVGELIGGSQREDDLELLLARIRAEKLPEEAYRWYLDLRRYGSVPHSGFGLGLERTVAWIAGVEHVREAIPFPRTMYRMDP